MVCGKRKILGTTCWKTFLSSRFLLLYCIIIIFVICTSYEYIINVSVGSTKYAAFVGVGMIAQLREDKSHHEDKYHTHDNIQPNHTTRTKEKTKSNEESKPEAKFNYSKKSPPKAEDKPSAIESRQSSSEEKAQAKKLVNVEDELKAKDKVESEVKLHADAKDDHMVTHILEPEGETKNKPGKVIMANKKLNSSIAVDMNKTVEDAGKDVLKNETIQREVRTDSIEHMSNEILEKCPEIPTHLQGKLLIKKEVLAMSSIISENPTVLPGGEDTPVSCSTRHNVAIIVPYRDRATQLSVFLRHIHPFLRRQDLHYRVYIINQADQHLFNRAMLMNVGFTEAMKDYSWDCCIFHDVDLLPEDDRNLYTCPAQPRHMSVAVDKFKYKLPYKTIFGGVAALSVDQFKKLNGFSNQFWGWGGEDDDMSKRIHYHKMRIGRYKPEIARYTMIKHKQEKVNKERARVLRSSHTRYKTDGLNSLKYKVVGKELQPLYTLISVELTKPDSQSHNLKIKLEKYKEIMNKHQEKHEHLFQHFQKHPHASADPHSRI